MGRPLLRSIDGTLGPHLPQPPCFHAAFHQTCCFDWLETPGWGYCSHAPGSSESTPPSQELIYHLADRSALRHDITTDIPTAVPCSVDFPSQVVNSVGSLRCQVDRCGIEPDNRIMYSLYSIVKGLPLLAAVVTALATYPAIPSDLTTPTQQRLAISGLNCMLTTSSQATRVFR